MTKTLTMKKSEIKPQFHTSEQLRHLDDDPDNDLNQEISCFYDVGEYRSITFVRCSSNSQFAHCQLVDDLMAHYS